MLEGRKGFGSIFVVASGNGGHFKDNCNFDGYANSIFTVTIGAVDELGQMPYYAEQCAAMLAVTFSSGQGRQRNIVSPFFNVRDYRCISCCVYIFRCNFFNPKS